MPTESLLNIEYGNFMQRKRDIANQEELLDLKQSAVEFLKRESDSRYDLQYFMNNQMNTLIDNSLA